MYSLTRKAWDSDFFGREFYQLSVTDDVSELAGLESDLAKLDASGAFGTEVHLNARSQHVVRHLERLGFRLVDGRMEFITETRKSDYLDDVVPGRGVFRHYRDEDWNALVDITRRYFVENPGFQSRYNDRWLFTEGETLRYYVEWHKWVLRVSPDLFVSWVDGDTYVGFYSILRRAKASSPVPEYKVALAAIEPEYRALNGQNLMQAWIFHNTPDAEWTTINSPALTNTSGIKNNIRARKRFVSIELFLFRKHPALEGENAK